MSNFKLDGYKVVEHAVGSEALSLLNNYVQIQQKRADYFKPEEANMGVGKYGDPLIESLLLSLIPTMEKETGLQLLPTYSYLRIYENGADLKPHIDRNACEISATLTLAYNSNEMWPIFLDLEGKEHPVYLKEGDMLIYRGTDTLHWREHFNGDFWIQAFLHYVDANGKRSDQVFDQRKRIGADSLQDKIQRFRQDNTAKKG